MKSASVAISMTVNCGRRESKFHSRSVMFISSLYPRRLRRTTRRIYHLEPATVLEYFSGTAASYSLLVKPDDGAVDLLGLSGVSRSKCGAGNSTNQLELTRLPRLVKPRLQRTIETQDDIPALVRNCLHPVCLMAF